MPNWRHSTAIFSPSSSRATNLSRSSIGLHSLQGTFALLAKGPVCNPCLRNELSPFSQEGQLSNSLVIDRFLPPTIFDPDVLDHHLHSDADARSWWITT